MTAEEAVVRRIKNLRLTEDEIEAAGYWFLEQMKPKQNTAPKLTSVAETWEEALTLGGDKDGIGGLSTGYRSLDDITGGLRGGQLIVIFGDTGHGKSLLTQNMTVKIAEAGHAVLYIGLEMTNAENTERFQNIGASRDIKVVYPLDIDMDYKSVEQYVRAAKAEDIKLVVVDHLHMFDGGSGDNEAQFLTKVCQEMKMIAIRYNVPVILVSHIKERLNGQDKGIPLLRDLKGSSSIKQLADSALAVHNEGMVSDDLGQPELLIKQRKSRRGRKQTLAKLNIIDGVKLTEKNIFA